MATRLFTVDTETGAIKGFGKQIAVGNETIVVSPVPILDLNPAHYAATDPARPSLVLLPRTEIETIDAATISASIQREKRERLRIAALDEAAKRVASLVLADIDKGDFDALDEAAVRSSAKYKVV